MIVSTKVIIFAHWHSVDTASTGRLLKTHHNMTNIVFEQLTARQAKTRTYCVLTWKMAI
jgi:hypothetical protein